MTFRNLTGGPYRRVHVNNVHVPRIQPQPQRVKGCMIRSLNRVEFVASIHDLQFQIRRVTFDELSESVEILLNAIVARRWRSQFIR